MTIKILGVDFRENAVSAVLARGSYKGMWLDAHARVFLEHPGDLENALSSCIETLASQADLSHAVCIASLPSDWFFYRNLVSPFTDQRQIEQTLPYELEQGLAVPADDLVMDFIPVSRVIPDWHIFKRIGRFLGLTSRSASTRVLAAAIETSRLAEFLSCLKITGLEPERIVPGGYALCLCLMHAADSPSSWLLVDTDRAHTAMFIVLSRTLTVIRAFPGAGLPSAEILSPLIQQTLMGSCKEIPIDRIFLSGDIADERTVASELSDKWGVPVHPVNFVADAGIRLKSDLPSSWKPEHHDPALGLAILRMKGFSGLNMRKGAFGLSSNWSAYRSGLMKTAVMTGLAVLAALAFVRVDTAVLEKQLEDLNRQIGQVLTDAFPEVTVIVEPLHQMRTHVQTLRDQIPGAGSQGQIRLVDLLSRISGRIPESVPVELMRLAYEDAILQLSGHTDSFNSVEEIKRRLEGPNGGFSQVTIISANLDNTGSRIQFHLSITI
jgi:type II secretion system protein L